MEISPETISKVKIKKVLKISIFTLLFFILALLIFEYFRITPKNVRFTNVTSTSVTLSWSTNGKSAASVFTAEKGSLLPFSLHPINKELNYDSRDVEKAEIESIGEIEQRIIEDDEKLSSDDFDVNVNVTKRGRYTTHHVQVKNLDPNTEYSFLVGDSILFRKVKDSSGTSSVKTLGIPDDLKTPSPTYGSVLNAENRADASISDLYPVTDGVIYLNLLDKESQKRSNIFSASLNSQGKWYIDISNAIDEDGNSFLEIYSLPGVNLYYELELDAGELGIWKTMDFASVLSPSEPLVINTPESIQDINIPGSVVKISNNVLGSFAPFSYAADGDCAFSKFCVFVIEKNGLYVSGPDISECNNKDYINSTLVARNCVGGVPENPAQENQNLSCSGQPVGAVGYNNHACYICQKQSQNGYYIANWVQTSEYEAQGTSCIKAKTVIGDNQLCTANACRCEAGNIKEDISRNQYCTNGNTTTMTTSGICHDRDGCICKGNSIKYGNSCTITNGAQGDTDKDEMIITNENRKCSDRDGCVCIWPNRNNQRAEVDFEQWCTNTGMAVVDEYEILDNNEFCKDESCHCVIKSSTVNVDKIINKNSYCTDGSKMKFSQNAPCYDRDGCTCEGNVISYGEVCTIKNPTQVLCESTLSDGDSCSFDSSVVFLGKWDIVTCSCIKPTTINGSSCFENHNLVFKNLEYWENGERYSCRNGTMQKISTTYSQTECILGETCNWYGWRERCLAPDMKTVLYCNNAGKWITEPEDKSDWFLISATDIEITYKGQKCQNDICLCETGTDHKIENGEYCIEVTSCNAEGQVCNKEGNTCKVEVVNGVDTWSCKGNVSTVEITVVPKGQKCIQDNCLCKTGTDHKIENGEYCIEVTSCYANGQVCNREGNTCKVEVVNGVDTWSCTGEIKSSTLKPSFELLSNNIVPKVFAQTSEADEYIIDPSTGLISGIESGIYTFEVNGTTYMFFVEKESLEANDGKILIFIDNDSNGTYDEGVDTKVSDFGSKILISTIQKEYSYKLEQGFNFVSFPFLNVNKSARTALGLLEMLNTLTNGSVYSIAKYDSNWEIVGKNGEAYLSNDFQLIPGQGYVIKVTKDVEVSIQGYPIKFDSEEDSAPITLFTGWNLIGIYGSKTKVYTAKSLLQDINAFKEIDFTVDIVNGWDYETQNYEGFVLEDTNGIETEYGFNFPINTLKSYFVRVQNGKGNWQPQLAE
jgi:hypothetical protein